MHSGASGLVFRACFRVWQQSAHCAQVLFISSANISALTIPSCRCKAACGKGQVCTDGKCQCKNNRKLSCGRVSTNSHVTRSHTRLLWLGKRHCGASVCESQGL